MAGPSSTFVAKCSRLEFTLDGDYERNCHSLLSILADFEREELREADQIRFATRLFNYASWLLYRYARPCCARVLCHGAIHLLRGLLQKTGSPYLYLLLFDELVNVGRLDRAVRDWRAAADLFAQVAAAVRGGWISATEIEPIEVPATAVEFLDKHVSTWAEEWWSRGVQEITKTYGAGRQYAALRDSLGALDQIPVNAGRAVLYRGKVDAYLGLGALEEALECQAAAISADPEGLEVPGDYLRFMRIYSGMAREAKLMEVADTLDDYLLPLMEHPDGAAVCEVGLAAAEVYRVVGMRAREERYLDASIRSCKVLGCQRLIGKALTRRLDRAVEDEDHDRVSKLCRELNEFVATVGYLDLRGDAYRAIGRGVDLLGYKTEADVHRRAAEMWERRVCRKTCDGADCQDSGPGPTVELDRTVREIFERMVLATHRKLGALGANLKPSVGRFLATGNVRAAVTWQRSERAADTATQKDDM